MKKILFVVDDLGVGGLQKIVEVISNSLIPITEVTKIYSHTTTKPFYNYNPIIQYRKIGILERYFRLFYLAINASYRFISKNKKTIISTRTHDLLGYLSRKDYDTLIITGSSVAEAYKIKKKFPNLNIILWMHNNHDIYFNQYFSVVKDGLLASMISADKIVVLTSEDETGYSLSGKLSDKIVKINNPLTLENTNEISTLTTKIISVTCRYSIQHKGLDYLVKVAQGIPKEWKIAIAGSGTPEEISEFKALIKNAGVEDKIILRGALEGKALQKHYQESSIYLMTSRWEGMPLVLAEAMSFGLPIIAYEQSGSDEVLEHGDYGILVSNGNIDSMVENLSLLMASLDLRKKYQVKSLQRVKDFSIEYAIEKWQKIL
ncbi:glycosyltransferase [Lactococcus lactis]|uniref:glycosyltransferase n=1 Tax=Lactococcus lactis TaxID=1358 RepID=UPI00072530B6|nr:glycosyltransferase [Lactococcus lactis]KST84595.1 Glycosyltransferase [Lactococcus lactis subsp. lactis]MCT0437592.1 glycosyltransferase family 4 protein [Lactococcus lactis subsp. lactis]MCT2919860.1 glycosyltransferase family 4 protein [Lactococcus lactis]MDG4990157.1 glycosyltransferase [Lactococcus lactis]NLS46898.1 glycosyltransferase [Lactococcus lactis]